jgi:hypothetical protein
MRIFNQFAIGNRQIREWSMGFLYSKLMLQSPFLYNFQRLHSEINFLSPTSYFLLLTSLTFSLTQ